jgi:hypothetical protein
MWSLYGFMKNLPDKTSTVDTFLDYSVAFYHNELTKSLKGYGLTPSDCDIPEGTITQGPCTFASTRTIYCTISYAICCMRFHVRTVEAEATADTIRICDLQQIAHEIAHGIALRVRLHVRFLYVFLHKLSSDLIYDIFFLKRIDL